MTNPQEIFEVLSHRRRRFVVLLLQVVPDRQLKDRQLAEIIVDLEYEPSHRERPKPRNVLKNLKRNHISRLEEVEIVEYNAGYITPGRQHHAAVEIVQQGIAHWVAA